MYPLLVLVHVVGVFGFLLAHGVSVGVAFRLRGERNLERVWRGAQGHGLALLRERQAPPAVRTGQRRRDRRGAGEGQAGVAADGHRFRRHRGHCVVDDVQAILIHFLTFAFYEIYFRLT